MATREENIKKINDELEKLTDEELDDVAGGGLLSMKYSYQQNQDQNNNQNNSKKNIFFKGRCLV